MESEIENMFTEDISEVDSAHEWIDEEQENLWAQTDILNIIKVHIKKLNGEKLGLNLTKV